MTQMKQPIIGLEPQHIESILWLLHEYYRDTHELPSAEQYLDLMRYAVEITSRRIS